MTDISPNCSIIIPTYNHPNLLRRLLNYFDEYKVKFEILIGDSSNQENKDINKRYISSFTNLSINYIDEYSSTIDPMEKFYKLLGLVKTKFCIFCADDDFVIPNSLIKSVKFLEKHPDYTAVKGHYIRFWVKKTEIEDNAFYWQNIYITDRISRSNNHFSPKSRLILHFASYIPTFYAVHRTAFLRYIFKETLQFTQNVLFSELLPSLLTVIYGKIKKINNLFGARDAHINTIKKRESIYEYIKSGTYYKIYNDFKAGLIPHVLRIKGMNKIKANKLIDNAWYLNRVLTKTDTILHSEYKLRSILKFCKILYKINIIDAFELILTKLFQNRYLYLKLLFREIYDKPSSKFYSDFNKIRKIVLKHSSE